VIIALGKRIVLIEGTRASIDKQVYATILRIDFQGSSSPAVQRSKARSCGYTLRMRRKTNIETPGSPPADTQPRESHRSKNLTER